jgi:hypothetical protein
MTLIHYPEADPRMSATSETTDSSYARYPAPQMVAGSPPWSFQVRDPENSIQYWVASCRSLGEALLNMSTYTIAKNADDYIRRASEVLNGAAAKISASVHPVG